MYGIVGTMYGGSAADGDTLSTLSRRRKVHIMTSKVSTMVVEGMRLPSDRCEEAEDCIFAVAVWA